MPQRNWELRAQTCTKRALLTFNLYLLAVLKTSLTSGFNYKFGDSQGFPCGSAGKESACNVGDLDLIPGLGRCPGEGTGHPLQYSGQENSMNCIVHGVAKSHTRLSDFHFHTVSWFYIFLLIFIFSLCMVTDCQISHHWETWHWWLPILPNDSISVGLITDIREESLLKAKL